MLRVYAQILFCCLVCCCLVMGVSFAHSPKDGDYINSLYEEMEKDCFRDSFHGLVIYDLDSSKYLFEYNADKYFTPASNVKIAALFAASKILGQYLPSIRYFEKGDSLIFWGTGDPTFLHPYFRNNSLIAFLQNKSKYKKLFFSTTNYIDEPFGDGWAWEDYRTPYGVEKSVMPIYGNAVYFEAQPSCEVKIYPKVFENAFIENSAIHTSTFKVERKLGKNEFEYNIGDLYYEKERVVPFHVTDELVLSFLETELGLKVAQIEYPLPENTALLYTYESKEMYKRMMQRSDNFLAEQTLLMCSAELFGELSTGKVIEYLQTNYFSRYYNQPRWVDGSGLSRYNLFTPRNFVEMLVAIRKDLGEENLLSLLAIGGEAGTLRRRYEFGKEQKPFLFGKTGTISNNHCLSGFLITKSGRKLCFSFQNNHHRESSRKIGNKMEEILTTIYEKY